MTVTSHAFRRPPGPAQPVELGIDAATLATLQALQAEFGNIVSVDKPGGRLAYFVNDPEWVHRILVRRHPRYRKGPGFERVKMLLGNGLIVSDGDVWRRSRTMIQPAFKTQKVHQLINVMILCADRLATRWAEAARNDQPINITEETNEFALELILISIFGADYETRLMAQGDNPFAFLSRDSARDLSVVLKVRELRNLLLEIISARRAAPPQASFDFLSMYIEATDKSGQPFSDDELLDELMTLIVAGFETSANTLNWVWYLLANAPEVEDSIIAEANAQMPGVDAVSHEAAAAMTYTQQVLEETLRLYPPVWLFTRRSHEDDEIADFDVPVGTDIYLSPFILHRTQPWWPDPERFDPARFSAPRAAGKQRPYFPFSLGPRRCLGEYFSFLEMKIHLGLLLPRFRLQLAEPVTPELDLAINLRATEDIWLKPSFRDAAAEAT